MFTWPFYRRCARYSWKSSDERISHVRAAETSVEPPHIFKTEVWRSVYDINLHNCTSQERHASSARRSRTNVRFSSLYDIKLAIVTSKYSNVDLCTKRVFSCWKLEKIDSKLIKEILGKICYERDDVWKALCYTAYKRGTATQEFHSVPNLVSLFLNTPKFC